MKKQEFFEKVGEPDNIEEFTEEGKKHVVLVYYLKEGFTLRINVSARSWGQSKVSFARRDVDGITL